MIIDKQGKLFGKISIIDIIVVLAVVVIGFGLYVRFTSSGPKVETVTQKIEYTMIVKDVREGTVNALKKGGNMYDTTTKEYIGTIVDAVPAAAIGYESLENGEFVATELPEKFDVTVTVQLDGKVNSTGYYTSNNATLTVGSRYLFTSKYAKTTGEIMDIKEIKQH